MPFHVLVGRKWHHPTIGVEIVQDDGIAIRMSMDDFILALTQEAEVGYVKDLAEAMSHPAFVFTRSGLDAQVDAASAQVPLLDRLKAAAARVTDGMKAETARVV